MCIIVFKGAFKWPIDLSAFLNIFEKIETEDLGGKTESWRNRCISLNNNEKFQYLAIIEVNEEVFRAYK